MGSAEHSKRCVAEKIFGNCRLKHINIDCFETSVMLKDYK
jgi:hypothetical protein